MNTKKFTAETACAIMGFMLPMSVVLAQAGGVQPDTATQPVPPSQRSLQSGTNGEPLDGGPPYSSSGGSYPQSESDLSGGRPAVQHGEPAAARPDPYISAMPSRLQAKTVQGVTYLCGGVGEEELSYMKQQARDYDLMLTFAARDGSYLADVGVVINNAAGASVLQTRCDGPMLLVDLPADGTYRVHAEVNNYAIDKTVKVRSSGQQGAHIASVVMSWPQQAVEAAAPTVPTSGDSGDSENGNRNNHGR